MSKAKMQTLVTGLGKQYGPLAIVLLLLWQKVDAIEKRVDLILMRIGGVSYGQTADPAGNNPNRPGSLPQATDGRDGSSVLIDQGGGIVPAGWRPGPTCGG